jgi:azurin
MKFTILALALVCSAPVFAAETVVKSCSVSMKQLDGGGIVNMKMEVLAKEDGTFFSRISQDMNGMPMASDDVASVSEAVLREGLTAETDPSDLNMGERLIVHAMLLTQSPEMAGMFTAGLDLSLVRSVKMYVIGEATNMGSATIVEARDAAGNELGSFLGGFLVSPCLSE